MTQTYDPVARLNELIKGIEFATLTTVRPDESLHSCPMATQEIGSDSVVWFLTSSDSEKVEAVRTQQRVNVAYVDHAAQRYVSVSGFCELTRDRVRSNRLWKPEYKAWLPGGVEDPNLVLLKINIQQAEYWDSAAGRMVELVGFVQAAIGE
jgi:general stress protein 26